MLIRFSYLVLYPSKLKTRAKIYERIVRITHLVREHGNYMSLTSIMASMAEYFVSRLSSTQALAKEALDLELDPLGRERRLYSKFRSHEKLVAPTRNYRFYRKAVEEDMKNTNREVQLIPILYVMAIIIIVVFIFSSFFMNRVA